tara:strand:+ start:729 stop:986 length:258 start_codon:yes stop_codon:yes gene_type:complete
MMNELIMQITIGSGAAIALIPYIKHQVLQNTKEIDDIKLKLNNNERSDGVRDTKIAVMESLTNNILKRLDKVDNLLEKILERLSK